MQKVKKPMAKKQLSPLEKARLAKANGTAKPKTQRAAYPTWIAPSDFKAFFCDILVKTDKDGLLSPAIKVTRYQGRWDPKADPRKKFDMSLYDQPTVNGILSRLSMVTFISSMPKRLPVNTMYRIVLRVGVSKVKGNALTITMKQVERIARLKSGKAKPILLERNDPIRRRFLRAKKILPAAFQTVLLPPKKSRKSKAEE